MTRTLPEIGVGQSNNRESNPWKILRNNAKVFRLFLAVADERRLPQVLHTAKPKNEISLSQAQPS